MFLCVNEPEFSYMGRSGHLCSKNLFYYGSAKCKGKSKSVLSFKPRWKMIMRRKKFNKIVAIEARRRYNIKFILIFRKYVYIFAILRCY